MKDNDCCFRIYTLTNPIDNSIFWVGKSYVPLKHRLCVHIGDAKSNRTKWVNKKKNALIKNILNNGLIPIIEEIEIFEGDDNEAKYQCEDNEKYWIKQFICWGFNLLNIRDRK